VAVFQTSAARPPAPCPVTATELPSGLNAMALSQDMPLPRVTPHTRYIARRVNCRTWASGMIAKTFFPA
jgi:hypothetical protein